MQTFVSATTKSCRKYIGYNSCTRNSDHLGVLIETGSTQKESDATNFVLFKAVGEGGSEALSKMMALSK